MVVIMDAKEFTMPPPPYIATEPSSAGPGSRLSTQTVSSIYSSNNSFPGTPTPSRRYSGGTSKPFSALPAHLVLYIVYKILPDNETLGVSGALLSEEELARKATRTLYWMANSLRFVNRTLYLSTMHILRSMYLPKYLGQVKKPYTSDPFPLSSHPAKSKGHRLSSMQRESHILDLFLLFQLREDVFIDDSCLHLEREDTIRDLFDFMQPRARLEDLVRDFGINAGLVRLHTTSSSSSTSYATSSQQVASSSSHKLPSNPSTPSYSYSSSEKRLPAAAAASTISVATAHLRDPVFAARVYPNALPFESISISYSSRKVGLNLTPQDGKGRKRTIVEVSRERSETLERCATRLIYELKGWADRSLSYR